MNNMTIVPRFDYVEMLAFLNKKYGNNIQIRCSTTDDQTITFTHLGGRIAAVIIHIGRFDFTLYMIDADMYGYVADVDLANERSFTVSDQIPVPTEEPPPTPLCAFYYEHDATFCRQPAQGIMVGKPLCMAHLTEAQEKL